MMSTFDHLVRAAIRSWNAHRERKRRERLRQWRLSHDPAFSAAQDKLRQSEKRHKATKHHYAALRDATTAALMKGVKHG